MGLKEATIRIKQRDGSGGDRLRGTLPKELDTPLFRRIYAGRGMNAGEFDYSMKSMPSGVDMKGIDEAARIIVEESIRGGRKTIYAGDYDADGANSVCIGVLGLRLLGATSVDYVVPDRFTMGYGLSQPVVDLALEKSAEVIITVDNGISSIAGVEYARSKGLTIVVTDHHLPGDVLPNAHAIVNPNQRGCSFAWKNLAGAGVIFYVIAAVRRRLVEEGYFKDREPPSLAPLLDLLAIATVGDVVRLDYANRVIVQQGLQRMRAGRARVGIRSLAEVAGIDISLISSTDLGFRIGPRINSAGRLENIRTGIECLLSEDEATAGDYAKALNDMNRTRRHIQEDMTFSAMERDIPSGAKGIAVADAEFHEGVVGLIASRLKDHYWRPSFAFARTANNCYKGSGRSIDGVHLRDALVRVETLTGGCQVKYGGHHAAAGNSIRVEDFERFSAAFDQACSEQMTEGMLRRQIDTDGSLTGAELSLETALKIESGGPWGQGFEEPIFEGTMGVVSSKTIGAEHQHARYELQCGRQTIQAVHFFGGDDIKGRGRTISFLFRMGVNRYRGEESLQLLLERML